MAGLGFRRLVWIGLFAAGSPAVATSLPDYQIVTLGLRDAEHTQSDGFQSSGASVLTDSGYAAGTSSRFVGALQGNQSAWLYDAAAGTTTRLGFFEEPEYTRSDGYQRTVLSLVTGSLTESGYVVGSSIRYSGASSAGWSAWLYDARAGTTTRIGFLDAAHVRSDGYQQSTAFHVSETGHVAGTSARFDGGTMFGDFGGSAWFYDPASGVTTRAGFFDAEHTTSSGFQDSLVGRPNASGDGTGFSYRYIDDVQRGRSAWFYDAATGTTTRLGFIDAEHTFSPSGYRDSDASFLTDSGYATGASARFGGSSALGQTAWLYDSTADTTTRLGFFDAEHTQTLPDGAYQSSDASALTESGFVVGSSQRFVGITRLGYSSWIYDATTGTTTRLGLLDAEHTAETRSGAYQVSVPNAPTESGYVSGFSERYSGRAVFGGSAWLHDPALGTSTRIGFFDAEHTRADGYQWSGALRPAESGDVAGTSERASGGRSAWHYDPAAGTTTRLGLFDAAHTALDGSQVSTVDASNESGDVAGHSNRFSGSSANGRSAWVYEARSGTQHSIILSERSDGYSFTSVSFLTEDRLTLGHYERFDANDASLGMRTFAWTAADGALDLGALVVGGLDAAGWSQLAELIHVNGTAQVLGEGALANGSSLAFLLVPVPEPRGLALLLTAGLVGLARAGPRHPTRPPSARRPIDRQWAGASLPQISSRRASRPQP